jgi:ubiquinone/menaquinone biosynthesis C-methylase UbiE
MRDWYERYYSAVAGSAANATYCERLAGRNFCQHDFIEIRHLDQVIEVSGMRSGQRVLDLGCGNGFIAEYLSDQTGARFVGLDYIPEAIRQAQERTRAKRNRLEFQVGDMARLEFPASTFDLVLSIDTLYFTGLAETLEQIRVVAKPGGRLVAFYSHGCVPPAPLETFARESALPDGTPLALVLRENGLQYQTWDYTQDDYRHALHKRQIAEALRAQFEAEGNRFLYDNHAGEAAGVLRAIEGQAHGRYLYLVCL